MIHQEILVLATIGVILVVLGATMPVWLRKAEVINLNLLCMWVGIIIIFVSTYYYHDNASGKVVGLSTTSTCFVFLVGCVIAHHQKKPTLTLLFSYLAMGVAVLGFLFNTLINK